MAMSFPYRFDGHGYTAESIGDAQLRELLEQVIFTAPGERLRRPDFGSGLLRMLFAASSPEVASAAQMLVQGALQQWLGDVLVVEEVQVESVEERLLVKVRYRDRRTGESRRVDLERDVSRA